MEAYPPQYVQHNLPLVLLSGLGEHETTHQSSSIQPRRAESGAKIAIGARECRNEQSRQLLGEFVSRDGTGDAWNGVALPAPPASMRFRIKTIGRTYTLPARKAAPLPQSPGAEGSSPSRHTELHSPLSPSSPGSPVFPDGIFTPLWFSKHQQHIPSLFLAFFDLNANEAAQDEQLKADINGVKNALSRSGFKTRLAVILISDRSILHAPELEDRLASIRRATTLDPKSGLFFMPPMSSQPEIATFVQSIMTALQPGGVDYYRDLSKHARRKKARGGPPPSVNSPIGASSQVTSTSGWNVRYEVKQGVFAEFRQEMDVAERHYSTAIEELFSSEGGVFETTASWSPRWDEARLLCDALAIRVIRCQLWVGQTTGAAQSWQNYKLRMRDLVDRRGRGSHQYSWDAWEARWAGVMSELIQMADVPTLQGSSRLDSGELSAQQIYAMPERSVDRLPPFNLLHHSGYWLRLMAKSIRDRWEKAINIPEEDRVPPGQSPASAVANRFKTYDVYLVPEPHEEAPVSGRGKYDHAAELAQVGLQAAETFEARRQPRMAEQMRLDIAEDLVRGGRYSDAFKVLLQLWEDSSWRGEEWKVPFGRLSSLLAECANRDKSAENASLIPALTWELLSLAPNNPQDGPLDITQCLDTWDVADKIELRLHDRHRLSPITAGFAFRERESHVGESFEFQLHLTYDTFQAAGPVPISRASFRLGGKAIVVHHEAGDSSAELSALSQARERDDGSFEASANLTLQPARRRIVGLRMVLREAQLFDLANLTIEIQTPKFNLTHEFDDDAVRSIPRWYVEKDGEAESFLLPHFNTKSVNVLPKPPKMQVHVHGLRKQFYTDERIHVDIELINEEVEAVHATVAPKIIGSSGETIDFRWASRGDTETVWPIECMGASAREKGQLLIQAPSEASTFTLTLDLRYTLASDTSTPLAKTVAIPLAFTPSFEAKFTFAPRLHPESWPSYFDPSSEGTAEDSDGIAQLWKLGAQITCLASESLKVEKLELQEHEVHGDASCTIPEPINESEHALGTNEKSVTPFELSTRKFSLDDRRPSYLDLSLLVTWSHDTGSGDSTSTTTAIAVPRLTIPTSEPRVLCTSSNPTTNGITISYHLENPSVHFLTFALTMEASEDFAFSGPKYRSLSLAPLSRHAVEYRLLVHGDTSEGVGGGVWVYPNLQVVDSYYQKNLRVHAGGKGVRSESVGSGREIGVWIGEGEPDE
ncbi:Hypothetical predicted protein [Lecanosticta acicola]|uniref:Trafficking protein particle complex subunit 11 n=1 Tax=Lecanosticta acicola TaxID=111012 RepID=A0AAI9EF20_9PEZI|nr:Hypothetical predicted protein [Lecanosticta acicola]